MASASPFTSLAVRYSVSKNSPASASPWLGNVTMTLSSPILGHSQQLSGPLPNSSTPRHSFMSNWRLLSSSASSSQPTYNTGICVVSRPNTGSPSAMRLANCCASRLLPTPPAPNNNDTVCAGIHWSIAHCLAGRGPITLLALKNALSSTASSSNVSGASCGA